MTAFPTPLPIDVPGGTALLGEIITWTCAGVTVPLPALTDALRAAGLANVQRLDTSLLDVTEPFGFRDGISQPLIAELEPPGRPGSLGLRGDPPAHGRTHTVMTIR